MRRKRTGEKFHMQKQLEFSCMSCYAPDQIYAVSMVSRYQSNLGLVHWITVKYILKYLRTSKNYILAYYGADLILVRYTDYDFHSNKDSRKSTSGYVFTLGEGVVSWRSITQSCIDNSTTEAEYVAPSEVVKQVIWL